MSLTYMAIRQLEANVPFIQSSISPGWLKPIVDWLIRLAVVAICASAYRAGSNQLGSWKSVQKVLFPITLVQAGGAYVWISSYIYQDAEVQRQFRDRVIVAEDEDGHRRTHTNILRSSEYVDVKSHSKFETWSRDGVVATIRPVNNQDLIIRFRNRKIWVTQHTSTGTQGRAPYWSITTWFWNRDLVDEFILAAHKMYYEKTDKEIHLYNHLLGSTVWLGPLRRPIRAWESVILPATIKQNLLQDVEQFLSKREKAWYASKGIPHRRGYLLHGPPGTGKTTLATAIASKLRMNMYCVSPAATGKLERLFQTCPPGSLLFIEDIDCVMPVNRLDGFGKAQKVPFDKHAPPSSVTLSGLLNAIDGVASQEDSVLFAATNFPDNLDAALRRPGRFDVDLKFDYATREQVVQIYKHFYEPVSPVGGSCESISTSDFDDADKSRVNREAEYFASIIEEAGIKVSIATIQGFLLLYKRKPELVREKVAEWAEGIRTEVFANSQMTIAVSEIVERGVLEEDKPAGADPGVESLKAEARKVKEKHKLQTRVQM